LTKFENNWHNIKDEIYWRVQQEIKIKMHQRIKSKMLNNTRIINKYNNDDIFEGQKSGSESKRTRSYDKQSKINATYQMPNDSRKANHTLEVKNEENEIKDDI